MKALPLNTSRLLLTLSVILLISSCKREYDKPPIPDIPVGGVIDIATLRNMYNGADTTFNTDISVYCVATTDEVNGNFYKDVYVQDATGAITLRLASSGGIYRGDSIRINLKGTTLRMYNDMLQLDSVDADENIVKQATGIELEPVDVTIDQLGPLYHSKLIRISDVQFTDADAGQPWADAINLESANRYLSDCFGRTVIVRTSGYANFAASLTPTGKGTIVGVFGQYGSDLQMYIRNTSEVSMTANRCIYLFKDFEDGSVTSGGWTMQNVTGAVDFEANDQSAVYGEFYCQISNYIGSANQACETWLISPAIDLSASGIPYFEFKNASNYSGNNIEVYISTNYDGISSPASATWTLLPATLSAGSWAWVSSGLIDVTGYKVNNVYLAFKYTGTSSTGKTWEIDNILVGDLN
jgi:hypothetical protein